MNRAGISRVVAMTRTGHKTESVYNRYSIVDEKDQQNAALQMEKYLDTITGTIAGTVTDLSEERAKRATG